MRPLNQLTVPGLLLLIALLVALSYFEKRDEGGGPRPASPSTQAPDAGSRQANETGNFDYYSLVLSWSPTHCASPEGQDDDAQCAPRNGRRYAFILHGLWPQYERGYPEDCPTRTRPYVPQPVIDDMMDIMPSKRLIIHEYRKHGTCSGLSPEGYYQTARRLYGSLKIPERFHNPTDAQFLNPRDVVQAFVAANPSLKPNMVAVGCGGPGSRLREVRICFSKTGELRACGLNEDQNQLCRSSRMHVPPVR
jgi:ribonuclease T2